MSRLFLNIFKPYYLQVKRKNSMKLKNYWNILTS